MREIFKPRRRIAVPALVDTKFMLEPPPELPRTIPVKPIKKALPYVFGAAMIGMIVMVFVSGIRQMNPMYLFFMAMMAIGLFQSVQSQGGTSEMTTAEVDSERAEYLRYVSGTAALIRAAGDSQRRNAEWSHPDPEVLAAAVATPRMWERGATDPDYLKVRVGRTDVALNNPVKVKAVDSELDLEPVAKTALNHMRAVQQSIPHCPKTIDLAGVGEIAVYGDRDLFAAAVRSWICQLVTLHTPTAAAVAVASPRLDEQWGFAKWLPHTESPDALDGAGPARYLATSLAAIKPALTALTATRIELVTAQGVLAADGPTKAHKHVLVVVDDEHADRFAVSQLAARDGVTVVVYRGPGQPDRDFAGHPRQLTVTIDRPDTQTGAALREWKDFHWSPFCTEPDLMDIEVCGHLARLLAKWDAGATGGQNVESQAVQGLLALYGIDNAAHLDVADLWAERPLEDQLRVAMGLQPGGAPIYIDIKNGSDGGNGPHGLIIAMTDAGKSKLLNCIMFGLLLRHSPDVVRLFGLDWKDEAGMDAFADFPHTIAVLSNMADKRSLVDRAADTLLGMLEARGRLFREAGRAIKGSAFETLTEYNAARATHPELPAAPTIFVVVDEFSLLLDEHPHMAGVFDIVCRKGRSFGFSFVFASQTLDEGKIKEIPANTQYRIALKVAKPETSRRIIGTEDAYHIPDGKNHKGTAYFVRAPGAEPQKFRGFLLPDRYEPPVTVNRKVTKAKPRARVFTAGPVQPDPDTVVEEIVEGASMLDGPPRSLVLTVGPQLAAFWGRPKEQWWAPPLDDPIPLDAVLATAERLGSGSPVPWWPLGEIDRPRALSRELLTYSLDQGHVSLMGKEPSELSMVATTFVLAAAARYTPQQIGFWVLSYGGAEVAALRHLPHVGAIGGQDRQELSTRIVADVRDIMAGRRRLFRDHDIASMADYRRRRASGAEPGLDDGYPVDMFLVVDGWEAFAKDHTSLLYPKNPQIKAVEEILASDLGLHVMITSADWIPLGQAVQARLGCKWELKMAGNANTQVRPRPDAIMGLKLGLMRPQERIPEGQPGRGINSAGDTIRFAVGRLDGQPTMDQLDEQVRAAADTIAARYPGVAGMPKPQLLPTSVALSSLPTAALAAEQFTLGLRGSDLGPLVIDFAEEPLLAAYGDPGSGRKTLLRSMIAQITERRGGDATKAIVCVFDPKRRLREDTALLIEGQDYYENDAAAMADRMMALDQIMQQRTPPKELGFEAKRNWSFTGPIVYLIINDLDAIPSTVQVQRPGPGGAPGVMSTVSPLAGLLAHLPKAREIGLRVIVTHKAAGTVAAESHPGTLPGQIASQNPNRILLSARPALDAKVAGRAFDDGLPPGRGYLVAARADNEGFIQLAAPAEVLLPC